MPVLRQAADDKTASIAPTAKRAEGAARKEAGLSQESPVVMSWRQSGEAPKARPGARTEATPRQAGEGMALAWYVVVTSQDHHIPLEELPNVADMTDRIKVSL